MKECPKCEQCYPDAVAVCPQDETPTKYSLPGTQLLADRYLLMKRLGRGAMGQVYLANDNKFAARKVAVKTVGKTSQQRRPSGRRGDRPLRTRGTGRGLDPASEHGQRYRLWRIKRGHFLSRDGICRGRNAPSPARREGTLPVKRSVKILRQIADGVEAAHEIGILHRDLKPANIFIMQRGKGDGFIKVGDFGLAKIVNQTVTDLSSQATPSSRGIIGTRNSWLPSRCPETGVDVKRYLRTRPSPT